MVGNSLLKFYIVYVACIFPPKSHFQPVYVSYVWNLQKDQIHYIISHFDEVIIIREPEYTQIWNLIPIINLLWNLACGKKI